VELHEGWRELYTLQTRPEAVKVCSMLYKIINDQVTIDPNTYLNKSDTRTRGEHKYKQIATSKNIYKYSFSPRTIRSWNYLPEAVAQATDLDSFRSGLEGIQFPPAFM
jgi:hypothetical protein